MAKITFFDDRCKSCKLCISVCPKNLLIIDESRYNEKGFHPITISDRNECIGCGFCATICPDCAIEVEK